MADVSAAPVDRPFPAATDSGAPIGRAIMALLLLVVLKAAAYWLGSFLVRPDDPLSTLVIYRGQDIQSLPLIRAIANLNPGEAGVLEWYGFGTMARIAPYIPHAVLLAIAGPAGFILADVIITVGVFLVLARVFRLAGIGTVIAHAVAALLVCLATNDFGQPGIRLVGVEYLFWGLRIPRPFVSDLFNLLAIGGSLAALSDLRLDRAPRGFVLFITGVSAALLLQADVFTATGLGLAFFAGFPLLLVSRQFSSRAALRAALVVAAWALLASAPFLVSSLAIDGAVADRLGVFPTPRFDRRLPFEWPVAAALILLVALSVILERWERRMSDRRAADARRLLLIIAGASLLALPVSTALLGRATQIYHYPQAATRALWVAAIVILLQFATAVVRYLRSWNGRRTRPVSPGFFAAAAVVVVAGPCLVSSWRLAFDKPRETTHMRTDVAEYAALDPYRKHFVDLIRRLAAVSSDGPIVLGTFDHQVWSWWVAFGTGYSYLPDACTTTLPADEIERRLITFARLIGMDRDRFLAFVSRPFVLSFWHSCAFYQANALYSRTPLSDYDAIDRRRIIRAGAKDSFQLILPRSERERLAAMFDSSPLSDGQLDVVVLAKATYNDSLEPPPERFERVYENPGFTMWRRR